MRGTKAKNANAPMSPVISKDIRMTIARTLPGAGLQTGVITRQKNIAAR